MEKQEKSATHWHALDAQEVFAKLDGSPQGLAAGEAAKRLASHGPNKFEEKRGRTPLQRFIAQVNNILIYILLLSAAITANLGRYSDTGVILGVVLINAIIGFLQEGKAEKALDAIRRTLSPTAVALRDGERIKIDASELVPGDVVALKSGDKVPADLRLFEANELQIEEAALTGEAEPVEKRTEPAPEKATVAERFSLAYSSTLVVNGQGLGVVVETGQRTEIGRLGDLLNRTEEARTPLLKKLDQLGRYLALFTLVLSGVTFALGYFLRNLAAADMFIAAVGIAVAAIPEGLPSIVTIALAIGVRRMAAKNAIIRKLPAVETLGSVTVICSDKTGTFTRNEMTVTEVEPAGGATKRQLMEAGVLVSDLAFREDGVLIGSPTEKALGQAALKEGVKPLAVREAYPRLDLLPFSSERRLMATLNATPGGGSEIFIKGAPEKVLEYCGSGEEVERLHDHSARLASQGMRVIAAAVKKAPPGMEKLSIESLGGDFTPLGLFGLMDPPREEAAKAVADCRLAGVRVIMITGDHASTATTIAQKLGITDGGTLTGADVEAMSDEELQAAVKTTAVFARSAPEHKIRIVTALQALGEVVAMTGDGVNDAPALKKADIGVAMGRSGTEAAKEASEMVLADDNFASIAHAVAQGRTVYDNIRKSVLFVLPINIAIGLVIVAAVALGLDLPILPVQILWINMVSAITLSLTLSFEPPEDDVMKRKPRSPSEPLLTKFLLWRVGFVSLLTLFAAFGPYYAEEAAGHSVEAARTVAVTSIIVFQCFYLMNTRKLYAPSLVTSLLTTNPLSFVAVGAIMLLQLLFIYAPVMQTLFATRAIDPGAWARIALAAMLAFLLIEAEKFLMRRLKKS